MIPCTFVDLGEKLTVFGAIYDNIKGKEKERETEDVVLLSYSPVIYIHVYIIIKIYQINILDYIY